jgi:glycosyltransferase involved in cell wall biosynthesis
VSIDARTQAATTIADPRQAPHVSVIVPVYNGAWELSRCLEALRLSAYGDFEVIVVDDCSTDDTPQIIKRYGARTLRTPHNMGPAGARNLGVRQALGGIVAFVDADVVVTPEVLGRIAADFDRDPELAAVFGSYDDAPAWQSFLSQYKNLTHHYVHQISKEQAVTFWAGCGAMRKSVFEEFGGFDEKQYPHPSIEDIELGYRLSMAGRKIRLDKQLQVKHLKKWTLWNLLRADLLYRAVPWTNLIFRTQHLPRDLNLGYRARLSSGLTGLLVLALLALPPAMAGWLPATPASYVLVLLGVIVLLLLKLNWRVYAFFLRKRGWFFTARAVLVHWFYYSSSGAVFFLCGVQHLLRSAFSASRPQGAEVGVRPAGPQT